MGVVRVLLTRRSVIGSLLIRAFTWSQWSHAEIIDGDQVIGANLLQGVVLTPLAHRLSISSYAAVVEFPCLNPQAVIDAARTQLGSDYDYFGLLGLVTHQRDWQSQESWFCSELVAWAFTAAGFPLFRDDLVARITPQDIWKIEAPAKKSSRPLELMPA